tara:strand:- start:37 stop:327 length:291 start_codon:yes stop_codon:yes gene_type:complete
MKLDIKSFLIGAVVIINLFFLMGFDNHEIEDRYDVEVYSAPTITNMGVGANQLAYTWFDKRTGEIVGALSTSNLRKDKPYIIYEGIFNPIKNPDRA